MTRKDSILFVSYHFAPSEAVGARRPTANAVELARAGYDVCVLRCQDRARGSTAPEGKPSLRFIDVPGHSIQDFGWIRAVKRRVLALMLRGDGPVKVRSRSSVSGETVAGASEGRLTQLVRFARSLEASLQYNKRWAVSAICRGVFHALRDPPDLIIASGPPNAGMVCGWVVSVVSRSPLVLDYRDPWFVGSDPEHNELDELRSTRFTTVVEDWLARRCAGRCVLAIAASNGIADHLRRSLAVPPRSVVTILNGYEDQALMTVPPPVGRLAILYSGTLYLKRNPFVLLRALKCFVESDGIVRERVHFSLVGYCFQWNGTDVRLWLKREGLEDVVELVGFVPFTEVARYTEQSNLLVNLSQGQGRQIPAKSYEYIASGRDTLVIAEPESDVAALFRGLGNAAVVAPDDIQAMVAALAYAYRVHVDGIHRPPSGSAEPDRAAHARSNRVREFREAIDVVMGN